MGTENLSVVSSDSSPAAEQYFKADDCLITVLKRAISNQQNIKIAHEVLGELYVLATQNEYFTDCEDLAGFLSLSPEQCMTELLPTDGSVTPNTKSSGRSIEDLMWMAVFYPSKGRLLDGYQINDVVQLERWPNLTRLPFTPNTFRILGLFSQRPTSVFFAARLLKIPQEEMYQIYSAARATGAIKAINRDAEEPQLPPHRNRNFLSSLVAKLALR